MKLIKISRRWYAITICFSLFLLAVLGWRLVGKSFKPGGRSGASNLDDTAHVLDSFSEPSVALDVLEREAEHLMFAYVDNREQAGTSQAAPLQNGAAGGGRALPGSSTSTALISRVVVEDSALKGFVSLHAKVRNLEVDMNCQIMRAYYEKGSYNDFLDCYLVLVQQAIDRPSGVLMFTQEALSSAQKCGRIEEVADTLDHLIRFHPNHYVARRLRDELEKWEAQEHPGPGANKR